MRKRDDDERLDVAVNIRIKAVDAERLDALASRFGVLGTRHSVARAALVLGLGLLEDDPTRIIVADAADKRARARR